MNQKEIIYHSKSLITTRIIKAPRSLVFKLFTTPEHVDKWWGPNGYTMKTEKLDLKPEGRWKAIMVGPDGTEFENLSIYKEITPNEKIVYEHGSNEQTPIEDRFLTTITFEDAGENTQLTFEMVFCSKEKLDEVKDYAPEGLTQTLNKLEEYLLTLNND